MRSRIRSHCKTAGLIAGIAVALVSSGPAFAADDLTEMSLEDLMNVTVTSATKREQSRFDAAAAITVLTNEDIRRSGATSVPEVLRLVPGLNVARINSSRWAITARGYNGEFANKLLVLIDGRVVYTPLFGGVYWDVQDLVLADIDRIEVIRGPGGTLWGANAVNGVINITTKRAQDTQGTHLMGLVGNQEYDGEARYGGQVGDDTFYRVYGRGFKRDDFTFPESSSLRAHDAWYQWRLGARVDSQIGEDDLVTIQGDFYDGQDETVATGNVPLSDTDVRGGNVLGRWTHTISDTQSAELQMYWDQSQREAAGSDETRHNVDVQAQHNFELDGAGKWLFNWGAEYWWSGDDIPTTPGGIQFVPEDEDFHRVSGFAQVQWNYFDDRLQVIGGTKLEWNSYTDFEYQPTGRILGKPIEGNVLWFATSRAVRAPTRVDRDLDFGGGIVQGNKDVQSENLLAIEGGYRNYMLDNVTLDVSAFLNIYDDFVGLDVTGLPTTFVNSIDSRAKGLETEVAWQAMEGLRFVTSYAFLKIDDTVPVGTNQVFGTNEGASPQHTWMLRGMWNVPVVPVELDTTVWYVSELTTRFDPSTPPVDLNSPVGAYWRLDLRLAWQATEWLGLEVVGQNLTEREHLEWGESATLQLFPGDWVPRSYYAKATFTF